MPVFLFPKTMASYILLIVTVYFSGKESQVSVILSLWDTKVYEHIILKPFLKYGYTHTHIQTHLLVCDACQWEDQTSIKKNKVICDLL